MNPNGQYFLYASFLRRYLFKSADTPTRDWTDNVLLGRFDTPQNAWMYWDSFVAMNKEQDSDFAKRISVCVADAETNFYDR